MTTVATVTRTVAFMRIARDWIAAQRRTRRCGLAVLLGAVAATALPPLYLLPLLVPAFTGLIWLVDTGRNWRAAAAVGWWFGLGHFVAGVYWISASMLVDAARFGWMVPFAVFGLSAYLALFPALATTLLFLSRARGLGRIFVFGAVWTGAEWLRGTVLTGFAWNLLGTSWVVSDEILQLASVVGALGLSLATVTAAALPAAFADVVPGQGTDDGDRPAPGRWPAIAAVVALVATVWLFGSVRLAGAEVGRVDGVYLRIVQPNIAQARKWRPELMPDNFRRHLKLSTAPGAEKVTHVIWPEAAAPYALSTRPQARAAIASVAPAGGLVITGAPRVSPRGKQPYRIWNSLYAIDRAAAMVAIYDKHHLVPFGEYVPLRRQLEPFGINKITPGGTDFSAGPGLRTLDLPGLPPASPLICYEVIFPGRAVAAGPRPGWLLNLTNDAWFGRTSGPYQHFASARMRAVEEGLPLVRAANTGISGVVDAYGRVVARLGLGDEGVVDSALPRPAPERTIFARFGNGTVAVLGVCVGLVGWGAGRRRS